MIKISEHISYDEATKSETAKEKGILNVPTTTELDSMMLVAEKIFEPIRKYFGKPLSVNSFYRSKELNKAIGGAESSQHCIGEAIDIDGKNLVSNLDIGNWAIHNLDFDELIFEGWQNNTFAWIHISFKKNGNRNKVMRADFIAGKPHYIQITA